MARPIKQGMDYFPHDTDACSDEKIEALRAAHGNDGYAFYFILLERIYRSADFEIDISDTEMGAEMKRILSRKVGVNVDEFERILKTALRWGCFDQEEYENRGVLTSPGIKKRARIVTDRRTRDQTRYQESAEQSGKPAQPADKKAASVSDAETPTETPTETDNGNPAKSTQSKVNIKKRKYSSANALHGGDDTPPGPRKSQPVPYMQIVGLWNTTCTALPKVQALAESQKKKLRTRWQEHPDMEWWRMLFTRMAPSRFLSGGGDKGWIADFNWIIGNDTNAGKVLSGLYDNNRGKKQGDLHFADERQYTPEELDAMYTNLDDQVAGG